MSIIEAPSQEVTIFEPGDPIQALIGAKVLVRSSEAGVFVGRLVSAAPDFGVVELEKTRRIWYWAGAASLSELALWGPASADECKFPARTPGIHIVRRVIEIIEMTDVAWKSIKNVPVWACHPRLTR